MARARLDDCVAVRSALSVASDARRDHQRAEGVASGALARADARQADAVAADLAAIAARDRLRVAAAAWTEDAPALDPEGRRSVVAAVDEIGESAPSLHSAYEAAARPVREALAVEAARAEDRRRSIDDERTERRLERDAVASEVDPGPVPPAWRRSDRGGRPGAPLWACCDFAAGVGEADAAGLEAALDAAGLLDAWISPSGALDEPSDGEASLDSWLVGPDDRGIDETAGRAGAATLARVLVPSVPDGCGLGDRVVAAALAGIGLGVLGAGVDRDGRFHLGPLRGRAAKASAEFIGAAARAERRRRRLADLDALIAQLDRAMDEAEAERRRLAAEVAAIVTAAVSIPSTTDLLDRLGEARSVAADAAALGRVATEATEEEERTATRAHEAAKRLAQAAAARSLPATTEGVDGIEAAVDALRQRGSDASAARRVAEGDGAAARQAVERASVAATAASDRAAEQDGAASEADGLRARALTLRAQLGPDAEEPIRALRRIDGDLSAHRAEGHRLVEERSTLDQELGAARRETETARDAVAVAGRERAEAEEHLAPLRSPDVLRATGAVAPQAPIDVPTDPRGFARWVTDEVGAPRAGAEVDRAASALSAGYKALLDDLRHGFDPSLGVDDGLQTVRVTSDAGTFPLATLAVELAHQEGQVREYLTEGDRELFERHLLTRVSDELRRLLNDADDLVDRVNRALSRAPTASGLRIELRWGLADDAAGMRRAVGLLRHSVDQLGSDDRTVLRGFFQDAIRDQRAEDPSSGYRAALEAALDYRSWHAFTPYMRTADGGLGRVTRTRFRELSGGEQAVTLHLPLFAAAAAHYDRAMTTAPRLIALDEAFAGIDEAMRGELMGLTVGFDLDVVMTGHELWGAYAQVPEVAIYDLLRRPPAEGVSALALRWDGAVMRTDDDATDGARSANSDGLF